jgi:CRISPR-associated protein Csa5
MGGTMFEPIVSILAYLGSQKDYSYIDRLGNAIDEISIMEALRDAVRSFITKCEEPESKCPSIDFQELDKSLNTLLEKISPKHQKQVIKLEVIKLARELSLKAYAKIKTFETSQAGG